MTYRVPEARRSAIEHAIEALRASERAVLTTHVNADGDGAGSEVALVHWLRRHGNEAVLVNPTVFPDAYAFLLDPESRAWVLDAGSNAAADACAAADLLVVLDTGEVPRVGRVWPAVQHLPKVVIDHHPMGPAPIEGVSLRDVDACATGELVFDLFQMAGKGVPEPAVDALYVAILTDTGSFRFSNTTAGCHRVTAELVELGARPETLYGRVHGAVPMRKFQLLRSALATLEADPDSGVAWMTVPEQDFRALEAEADDIEGFVDYPRSVEGTEVGLLFRTTRNGTKISFRSNGAVDVNALARRFGGGGHVRAAGAHVERPLDEVRSQVVEATRLAVRDGGRSGA